MPTSANRALRSSMIPWIVALVLLFGISAVTPDHPSGGKQGVSKEATASQAADHAQLSGHSIAPLLKLPAIDWIYGGLAAQSSSLLRVDHSKDRSARQFLGGVAQGRAPPAYLSA